MEKIIIQELDNRSRATHTYKFDTYPVTIGRGYNNDLILDDAFVCSSHAHIDQIDGNWRIIDDQSKNGVIVKNRKIQVNGSEFLQKGDVVELGKTQLKIVSPSCLVAESRRKKDSSNNTFERFLPLFAWALSFVCLMLIVLNSYLNIGDKGSSDVYLNSFVFMERRGMVLVGWAFMWSLVGYVLKNKSNFHFYLFWMAVAILTFTALGYMWIFILYNVNYDSYYSFLGLFRIIIGGMLFAFCLKAASNLSKFKIYLFSSVIVILIIAVDFVDSARNQATTFGHAISNVDLIAPWAQIVEAQDLDQVLQSNEKLFQIIDR